MEWIIEDWTSQHVYRDKKFGSFEEARDFISEVARQEAGKLYEEDLEPEKYEEIYNGICEDLYAIEVKD